VLHPRLVVLADGGFALEYWLLKPFPLDEITTPKRHFYNICLTSTREILECAFGLLKGRWRVLRYVSAETELVPSIMEACVLLPNFLIDVGEEWGELLNGSGGGSGDVHPDVGVTAAYHQALHLRDQVVDLLWQTRARLKKRMDLLLGRKYRCRGSGGQDAQLSKERSQLEGKKRCDELNETRTLTKTRG